MVYSSSRNPLSFCHVTHEYSVSSESCTQIILGYPNLCQSCQKILHLEFYYEFNLFFCPRMHLVLTLYTAAEIRFGLSPTCGINELSNRGHSGADRGHDIEILPAKTTATLLSTRHCYRPPGDGERWLFHKPRWPLHYREGKALARHNESFKRGASATAGACFWFVRPAYLHRAFLVTDSMAFYL